MNDSDDVRTDSLADQSRLDGPGVRTDDDALAARIERNLQTAINDTRRWRSEAERCFMFRDGYQWSDEDLQELEERRRPAITFNRAAPIVDMVAGMEIMNRHEVRYVPVEIGDAGVNELLTGAAEWVRDKTQAEFEESCAFKDMLTCGLGLTMTRIDYDEDPDGKIVIEAGAPMAAYWDTIQKKARNHRWRAYVKIVARRELEEMFGKEAVDAIEPSALWKSWLPERGDVTPHDATSAYLYQGDARQSLPKDQLPLVEYQYWEKEASYRVAMPQSGIQEYSKEDFAKLKPDFEAAGVRYVKVMKRRYRRAFLLGKTVLEDEATGWPDFTIQMMTGKRDDEIHGWYGLLRPLIGAEGQQGPQQMANKLYTEIVHVIAVNAKGGVMAESNAVENWREFEDTWADAASVIRVSPGALTQGAIQPKPLGQYPQGMDRLLEWTIRAVPEVTGVNYEMLGMVNRDQPGVLEYQRKQAGLTILAEYMDAIRLYRIRQGGVLVHFIVEYLAGDTPEDSQLVRLKGQAGQQYVPLLKDKLTHKFDIVVDEAPSSPNVKERTWAVLQEMLPTLLKIGLMPPPEVLDYSPLPESLREAWKRQVSEPNPQQEEAAAIEKAQKEADVAETQSKVMLNQVKAQSEAIGAQVQAQGMQLDAARLQVDAAAGQDASRHKDMDREATQRTKDADRQAGMLRTVGKGEGGAR